MQRANQIIAREQKQRALEVRRSLCVYVSLCVSLSLSLCIYVYLRACVCVCFGEEIGANACACPAA
jgi:hypothetical protein